ATPSGRTRRRPARPSVSPPPWPASRNCCAVARRWAILTMIGCWSWRTARAGRMPSATAPSSSTWCAARGCWPPPRGRLPEGMPDPRICSGTLIMECDPVAKTMAENLPAVLELPVRQFPDADARLMLAYARGDSAAFDALYARYRGPLYRYFLRQCRRPEQ